VKIGLLRAALPTMKTRWPTGLAVADYVTEAAEDAHRKRLRRGKTRSRMRLLMATPSTRHRCTRNMPTPAKDRALCVRHSELLNGVHRKGESVVFEGAREHVDIDHGTYPCHVVQRDLRRATIGTGFHRHRSTPSSASPRLLHSRRWRSVPSEDTGMVTCCASAATNSVR